MSLSHAILGLLTVTPMTGYDLKNRAFDTTVAHFWKADQSQIYRTLNQLSEAGWVEAKVEAQEERPDRKVYSITDAGRAELINWLQQDQRLPATRDPFLVQLFFAGHIDNETILEHIARQRQSHEAKLRQYQQIEIPHLNDPNPNRMQVFWRLTLEMGIATEKNYLAFLAQCEKVIRT
ncbi:MAG: PadR family transcriptional regulator, partial [Chloroflexi bacterium]|nr:PadR family transcriptional regulator [Chloroflexota bacterium]